MSRATTRKPKPRPTAAPAPTVGNADPLGSAHDLPDAIAKTDPIGNAHDLPEGISRLSDVISEAMRIIAARQAAVEPITLRLDDVAVSLRVSRSTIERLRRTGKFPKPDMMVGRMPLWRPETIRELAGNGGGR